MTLELSLRRQSNMYEQNTTYSILQGQFQTTVEAQARFFEYNLYIFGAKIMFFQMFTNGLKSVRVKLLPFEVS